MIRVLLSGSPSVGISDTREGFPDIRRSHLAFLEGASRLQLLLCGGVRQVASETRTAGLSHRVEVPTVEATAVKMGMRIISVVRNYTGTLVPIVSRKRRVAGTGV